MLLFTGMRERSIRGAKDFFHTCINDTTSQNPERFFFSRVKKMIPPSESHSSALIWRQNFRFLYDLAAPSLSELLRSLSRRKFIVPRNESFFS